MKRVLVLVEGQTEEAFVNQLLAPALESHGLCLIPIVLVTKRTSQGHFKGGVTTYSKVRNDLVRLFGDTGATAVTTMLDYYRLPSDFPGVSTRSASDALSNVLHVESAWKATFPSERRFLPYLWMHEFEAAMFVDLEAWSPPLPASALPKLTNTCSDFTPEQINGGEETAPSKRILAAFPAYQKVTHGLAAARAIGISHIRAKCAHFDAWVKSLLALPDTRTRGRESTKARA
jgi:Domain of unknown function (DUF4276)